MKYELSHRFYFEAAHRLVREIEVETSSRIHGHTYYVTVTVSGVPNSTTGMLLDLGYLREKIEKFRLQIDHHYLNDIPEIGVPTLENLCRYIMDSLRIEISGIARVVVERPASGDSCALELAEVL